MKQLVFRKGSKLSTYIEPGQQQLVGDNPCTLAKPIIASGAKIDRYSIDR